MLAIRSTSAPKPTSASNRAPSRNSPACSARSRFNQPKARQYHETRLHTSHRPAADSAGRAARRRLTAPASNRRPIKSSLFSDVPSNHRFLPRSRGVRPTAANNARAESGGQKGSELFMVNRANHNSSDPFATPSARIGDLLCRFSTRNWASRCATIGLPMPT